MNGYHHGFFCQICGPTKGHIYGTRYACLMCPGYDLCEYCNSKGSFTKSHGPFHPMQPIPAEREFLRRFSYCVGPRDIDIYRCPYCEERGFSLTTLLEHLKSLHRQCQYKVRCPVCVTFGSGGRYATQLLDWSLAFHIENEHNGSESDYEWRLKLFQYVAASYQKQSVPVPLGDSGTCNICSGKLIPDGRTVRFEPCVHGFHRECIRKYRTQLSVVRRNVPLSPYLKSKYFFHKK
ncbi:E3 ubiquitin-protein ligase Kcmf1-like [Uranotaenia lowii]|uniref:E3 ubiquitin-protein ligase Kcmf1-like n=1 Tax=Uranotaenia lowii TaxID=190385 RepID=UPI00247AE51F|nr:E3 ubiquitin-protein ligase Kcmf1-like [Uranotaenia lowii]